MTTKEEKLDLLIRLVFESLQSHLDGAYTKTPEGKKFHIQCVKDYSLMIKILSELY